MELEVERYFWESEGDAWEDALESTIKFVMQKAHGWAHEVYAAN